MNKKKKLQLGKQWGLRRMANAQGHFTMVALDQRPPIINLIAAKRGVAAADVAFADVLSIKLLLVDVLGPYSCAMLLDPNYAFPAALASLPARTGLVVTLEEHKFEETPDGRRSANIDNWSVAKIKRAGGDGVKVLAWYRPDASTQICGYQKAYVKSIGEACREQDIPFVFELLVYPFPSNKNHTTDYVESPEKLPSLVLDSVREFAKPEYGVDLLKLESPLAGANLPARDGSAMHLEAQAQFDEMGRICADAGLPWVMLSAGVTAAQFIRVMEYAYAAGANGFLAGRAIWSEALQSYPDLAACRAKLAVQGPDTLRQLGDLTARAATAWKPDYSGFDAMQREGDVCSSYS